MFARAKAAPILLEFFYYAFFKTPHRGENGNINSR
jgi:hypothetical protein